MKRVLMLAFHFPPMKGSSGLQRTLNFARDLPQNGWLPRVVSVSPMAYPAASDEQMHEIPTEVVVRRLPCLDVARHLSFRGRYLSRLASPDRWWSWLLSAVPVGLWECTSWKPDVIWSTYPIPTAVLAGKVLAQLSGIPWVVDLRDTITEEHFPRDRRLHSRLRQLESEAVRLARAVVFTSRGAMQMYAERYPQVPANRWVQIANGFDEESFKAAERLPSSRAATDGGRLRLLHSGLLDPVDRDPRSFFSALSQIHRNHAHDLSNVEVTLRATGHDDVYRKLIESNQLQEIVRLAPPIPYVDALREMLDVDGLLVFQASNCNHQTPAKLYEYMRAGRPIFAITDHAGDTAATLELAGCPSDHVASISDGNEIVARFSNFLRAVAIGAAPHIDPNVARRWRRSSQSAELATVFDRLTTVG